MAGSARSVIEERRRSSAMTGFITRLQSYEPDFADASALVSGNLNRLVTWPKSAGLFISLETRARNDPRLQAFVIPVVIDRMKEELGCVFDIEQSPAIGVQIRTSLKGTDFSGHIRDVRRQNLEAGVP
jgi:hypothetical protein